ncbi:hypothetical protein B4U79_19241, partial [Dinothrombium tinctorium]
VIQFNSTFWVKYADNDFNEFALINIRSKVVFDFDKTPICLPKIDFEIIGKEMRMVNFKPNQFTRFSENEYHREKEYTNMSVDFNTCKRLNLLKTHICTESEDFGDICGRYLPGAPLVVKENKKWIVVGVLSFSFNYGQKRRSVFASDRNLLSRLD